MKTGSTSRGFIAGLLLGLGIASTFFLMFYRESSHEAVIVNSHEIKRDSSLEIPNSSSISGGFLGMQSSSRITPSSPSVSIQTTLYYN